MEDLLDAIQHTPLPTILVISGIVFWLLAIAGSIAGKITVQPSHQKAAGIVGSVFIAIGLILLFVQKPDTQSQAKKDIERLSHELGGSVHVDQPPPPPPPPSEQRYWVIVGSHINKDNAITQASKINSENPSLHAFVGKQKPDNPNYPVIIGGYMSADKA